jgi:hypothetical protein
MVDIVVHQYIRRSEVILCYILKSDHLQVIFSILGPVSTREALAPVEKLTDWGCLKA